MQDKIRKILNEEQAGHQYDWMKKSQPISVSILDILKLDRNEWERAKAVLPYQANPIMGKILAAIESGHSLKSDFNKIISHPIIRKDKEKRESIKKAQAKLNGIMKAYSELMKELDNLHLGG